MSIEELQKEVARLREENRLLQFAKTRAEEKLKDLLRRFFGPKSEKMDPAQLRLALESIQADEVLVEEEPPAPQAEPSAPRWGAPPGAGEPASGARSDRCAGV